MTEFDSDAVASIVRRAVELDATFSPSQPGIDRAALVQAATEAGVERSAIELAIAEHLVRPAPDGNRFDAVVGPRYASASRRINAPFPQVDTAVGEWLTRARFRPLHRERGLMIWERRTDVAAGAHRLAATIVGGDRFKGASRIEVEIAPIDAAACLVQIRADRSAARGSAVAGSTGLATIGTVTAVAGALTAPALVVLSLPIAAAAVGMAVSTKNRTSRAAIDLDRLLDQLAAAERPSLLGVARPAAAWRERARRTSPGAATSTAAGRATAKP